MRKSWRGLALVVSAALAAAGCSGDQPESGSEVTEVTIGVLDPVSGSNATTGQDAMNGTRLAVDIINGGFGDIDLPLAPGEGLPNLNNAKIRLVEGDTQGRPEDGASEAERLVTDEGAVALTGAYNSSVTLTASERAERLRVPFVNGDSSSTSLTERGLEWFFRTGPHDQTFGETFFSLLKQLQGQDQKVTNVGILHTNDEFGSNGAEVTAQLAQDNGFNVVAKVPYEADTQDLRPQVIQVRDKDPDVLFVLSYITDSLLLTKTLKELNYYPKAIMGYGAGFSDPKFIEGEADRDNAEGFTRRSSWSADLAARNPTAQRIAAMFEEKYGTPMTENSARTFTAMMTLAMAIDNARSSEPDDIRSALKNMDVPGRDTIMPWDGVKFDDNQQNTGAKGVVEQLVQGQWKVVYPPDVQALKLTIPLTDTN